MVCSVFLALLMPFIAAPRPEKPRVYACASNQKQIIQAALLYAQENGEVLPMAITTNELSLLKKVLHCPTQRSRGIGYGYNQALQGRKMDEFADYTMMPVTADGGTAQHFITTIRDIDTTRHNGHAVVAFLDGHVEQVKADKLTTLLLTTAIKPK